MLHAVTELLAPATMDRLTLVVNHVLGGEPQATARLLPHAGRSVVLIAEGWPALLPPAPPMSFRITPAGLLEWCGMAGVDAPDLRLHLNAADPARLAVQMLSGQTPAVRVEGDAQLATDIGWLLDNLRWDVEADLERLFGPMAAHSIHQLGSGVGAGLRAALRGAGALAAQMSTVMSNAMPGAGSSGFPPGSQ